MIIKQIFTEPETEVKWYCDSIEEIIIVYVRNRLRGTFACACYTLRLRLVDPSFQFCKRGPDYEIQSPTGLPSTGAPNQRWGTKNLRFSISILEIPIPILNTEVFQNTDTEYRTNMKKIPTKILNTDTDSKYRYRPSSSLYRLYSRALS